MPKILGIDIGTSSSALAYSGGGAPMNLSPSKRGRFDRKGFLSWVMFGEKGEFLRILDEEDAREKEIKHSGFLLRYFKRIIGRSFEDINNGMRNGERFLSEYKEIIQMKDGEIALSLGKRKCTPEQIMSAFLKVMEIYAREMIGEKIERTVIAVPLYFGSSQREALGRAAEKVFGPVELIEEPLAAILGSGLEAVAKRMPVVVFDFGVGNLEIDIAKIALDEEGKPKLVILQSERRRVGGIDMDYCILQYLMEENRSLRDAFPCAFFEQRRNFLRMVEEAKIILSSDVEARVEGNIDGEPIEVGITRHKLEELIKPTIKDCEEALRQVLERATLTPEKVSHLVLVGGPTRMSVVRKMLKEVFKDNKRIIGMLEERERGLRIDSQPIEVIAKGAAVYPFCCSVAEYKVGSAEAETIMAEAPIARFTYGLFYGKAGFVPLINKGEDFREEAIQKERTVLFSKPNGQIPIVARDEGEERRTSYLCLGVFSFFLPPQDSCRIKLILKLNEEGLTLVGSHQAIGEVVYPNIYSELSNFEKEIFSETTLKGYIHNNLMIETVSADRGHHWMVNSEEARKYVKIVHEKIGPYYQKIPELKEMTDRLGEELFWLRKMSSSKRNRSLLESEKEVRTAVVLNRAAEACFALLRYQLLSFNEYRKIMGMLHTTYRTTGGG
ncbi:Hsp70 family protein [bacterium]|nr:Hsp70 family protein [bacterium]